MVEEYVRDFTTADPSRSISLVSLDTPEGDNLARLYDVVAYPTIVAVAGDGNLLQSWQGLPFPLMNDLAAYVA